MKPPVTGLPLLLTAAVLLTTAIFLGTGRLEYCGQPEALRPPSGVSTAAKTDSPTPAPPRQVVFIQIETDKSDLEIGWIEN